MATLVIRFLSMRCGLINYNDDILGSDWRLMLEKLPTTPQVDVVATSSTLTSYRANTTEMVAQQRGPGASDSNSPSLSALNFSGAD